MGPGGLLAAKSPPSAPTGPYASAIAITPDQGPVASFTASPARAGSPSAFNGSASSDPDGSVARYDWSFGDGTSAVNGGPTPSHAYAAPGTYTVTLQVTDNEGCSATELFTGQTAYCNASPGAIKSATIGVSAGPSAHPSSLPTPSITAAHQSASTWRESSRLAQITRKHKPPIGTTFSFSLNEQASVSFSFTQQVAGRKVGHKCVAQTKKNAKRRTCKRTVTVASLSFAGHGGTNKVAFQGRISRSQKLKPGRYTLIITATNTVGHSTPKKLSFTIVK